MFGDAHEAEYYRRRAADQAASAEAADDAKVAGVHRELATLYEARARTHAERANAAAVSA